MNETILLGDMPVEVVRKGIKNIHLSVHPPAGRVSIAAPERTSLATLRVFALSKLAWIRAQQRKLKEQEREAPREYRERESHYFRGRRYLLRLVEADLPPLVELKHRHLELRVRPGTSEAKRREILEAWYRERVREEAGPLIEKWEKLMRVKVKKLFVQRMKTKWGACNPRTGAIRLNTDLAKKPPECLEYLIVHELAHLIEPTHNARFQSVMDLFMPEWKHHRDSLNRLPVRHEDWEH